MQENSKRHKEEEEKLTLQKELVYEGKLISVYLEILKNQNGSNSVADFVKHPGAVAILPIDDEGNLFLIRQWRRAIGQILIEIPAGILEKGENPSFCAERELQEEIGFKPSELISLGGFYAAPGFCDEYIHLFLAKGLTLSQLQAEDTDGIDVFKVSLKEAFALASQKQLCDSKTLAALCLYKLWLKDSSWH